MTTNLAFFVKKRAKYDRISLYKSRGDSRVQKTIIVFKDDSIFNKPG